MAIEIRPIARAEIERRIAELEVEGPILDECGETPELDSLRAALSLIDRPEKRRRDV